MSKTKIVSEEQIRHQMNFVSFIAHRNQQKMEQSQRAPKAFTHTYGCQQNEADTQKIAGMLHDMGYEMTEDETQADIIVFNTCAVRENAENRVFGNVGALAHLKKQNPDLLIALCGCMMQQEHIAEKIKKSYPQVDLVFGTHALWRFPELLYRAMTGDNRVFDISGDDAGEIVEGLPVLREGKTHAWLSIMYGCNNFCTYCIVPYVRGRERSRSPEAIDAELRELVSAGYRDITLLGQNVNSYGKDLDSSIDFADLLRRLNDVPGEFVLRFMTSHPKDASHKLIDTMAACEKVAKQLHLPFQSGSDEILKRMNRGYTAAQYQELIHYARQKMPQITISSDIIVGFPGETEQDFAGTLELVENVGFDSLYTFQYSKRSGTPAASYDDFASHEEKQRRFAQLLALQDRCAEPRMKAQVGKRMRVLVDGKSRNPEYPFSARTEGNLLVYCAGDALRVGEFAEIMIQKAALRSLCGKQV